MNGTSTIDDASGQITDRRYCILLCIQLSFLRGEEHLIDDAIFDRERWNSHRTFVWFVITSSEPINFLLLILYWFHFIQSWKIIFFTIWGRPNKYFCICNDERFRRPWRLIVKSPRTQKWELRTWDGIRRSGRCFRRKNVVTPTRRNQSSKANQQLVSTTDIVEVVYYCSLYLVQTEVTEEYWCIQELPLYEQETNYHYPVATLLAMENKNSSMTSSIPYNRIITTIWDVNRPLYLLIFSWVF